MRERMKILSKYVKKNILILILFVSILLVLLNNINININYKVNQLGQVQLYYYNNTDGYPFSEEDSEKQKVLPTDIYENIDFNLKLSQIRKIRLDIDSIEKFELKDIKISTIGIELLEFNKERLIKEFNILNDIVIKNDNENFVNLYKVGPDSFIATENINLNIIFIKLLLISMITTIILIFFINKLEKNEVISIKYVGVKKEYILVCVFIFMIMVPNITFYIPKTEEKVNLENRNLTEKPKLYLTNLDKYTQEFEKYYNDNLPFKDNLVKLNSRVKYSLFKMSPQNYVIKGSDDWLFYNSKYKQDADTASDYMGTNYYTPSQLEEFKDKIISMRDFVEENGAKFYLMIPPNKSQIYSNYMPKQYKQAKFSKTDLIIAYLKEQTDINIIYPKQEILKLKDKYQLYYKLDTHWNNLGAYIGYSELKKVINSEEIPNLNKLKVSEEIKYGGDLASMIGLNDELLDKEYSIQNYKEHSVNLIEQSGNSLQRYESNNKNNKKLLCFRDSYFTALIPYLNQDFEESIFLWQKNLDKEIVKKEKPDIVIMESVERLIDSIN